MPALLFATLAIDPVPANSAIIGINNPSFELADPNSGKPLNWDVAGVVSAGVQFNIASPPREGDRAAILTASPSLRVPREQLELLLELPAGRLNTLGQGTVDGGSALAQTVALPAGKRLVFDFDFGIFNFQNTQDFALFSITREFLPGLFFDEEVFVLADTDSLLTIPPGDRFPETSYRRFVLPITETAIYRIGFAVVNANGNQVQSALAVDWVRVVPEPPTFVVLLCGLCMALCSIWRRRGTSA
ncbi:MAG: hypothetical protein WD341_14860 [Tistlia sp.]|uniref:hypothetical protein n=1 Tax=Tistlia sp. TaxID=3057121 RepID=UPI0034A3D12D